MDFFDAVEFLREEEDFDERQAFFETDGGLKEEISFSAESFRNENIFNSQEINENTENFYAENVFVSEPDFPKAVFPSENHEDVREISVNSNYGNSEETENTFNSVEEVSAMENIDNSNKNAVINIDARSYNTISQNVDLEDVSDYIADRLADAVSAFTEVVHNV